MTTRGGRWVVALGLAGCSPATEATLPEDGAETGVSEPSETGLDDESSTGAVEEESTGSDDDGVDESGDESSSGGEPAVCGNGIVEDGEGCDDNSAGCRSDCQRPCSLALEVHGDADRYDAVTFGDDGVARVVGTSSLSEDSNVFVTMLDDDLLEGRRQIVDQTGAFELARSLMLHDGDQFSVLRLREDADAPADVAIDLIRQSGSDVLWTAEISDSVTPNFFWGEADAAPLADGGVAVTSTFLPEEGGRQIWVGRYAPDGTRSEVILDAMAEGLPNDRGHLVVAGPDGTLTIAGTRASTLGGFGVRDPLVTQIGPDDSQAWSWSEWTGATNLTLDPRGAAMDGAGRIAFSFNLDHDSPPAAHAWIVVFEPDGKVAWQLDTDDIDEDAREAGALVFDAADRLISVGYARSEAGGFSNPRVRISGFDPEGVVVCDEALNETVVNISDAALDPDGNILAVGFGVNEDFESYPAALRIHGFE